MLAMTSDGAVKVAERSVPDRHRIAESGVEAWSKVAEIVRIELQSMPGSLFDQPVQCLGRVPVTQSGKNHDWTNEESAALDSIHLAESAVLSQSKDLSVSAQSLETWLLARYSPEQTDRADKTAALATEMQEKDWFEACQALLNDFS